MSRNGHVPKRCKTGQPTRRQLLAEQWMRVPGMTQTELAKMFGVKQPAISLRLKGLAAIRGEPPRRPAGRRRTAKVMQLQFDV